MRTLDVIASDGVTLPEREGGAEDVSLLSLKVALQAYFSTYQTMKYSLHLFEGPVDDDIDNSHKRAYYGAYAETIYHFHHFIELSLRRLLFNEHPLLAADARSQPVNLHRLLKREGIDPVDYDQLQAPAMNIVVETICALLKAERMDVDRLGFIQQSRPLLDRLSNLRNRLSHRGSFVLRYPALDELVGAYLLPFVMEITALDEFSGQERTWRQRELQCEVDPISEIVESASNGYNLRKVAFLKELGRAAYLNPLMNTGKATSEGFSKGFSRGFYQIFDQERVSRARNAAASEVGNGSVIDIKDCPVCGVHSLLVYDEIATAGEEIVDGQLKYDKAWRYTWQVECVCCTFQIDNHLGNASEYELPIEDYWQGHEL